VTQIRLTPSSLAGACFIGTLCLTPISLARLLIASAGNGTMLWMVLAGLVGMLGAYLNIRLLDAPLAPWAARSRDLLGYARALFYAAGAPFMLNVWVTVLGGEQLELTPRLAVALLAVTVVAYVLRLGVESTLRLVGLVALIVAPTGYLLLSIAFLHADPARLLPHPLGTGSIPSLWPVFLFLARGFDVLPPLAPYVAPAARRVAYVGIGVGSIAALLAVVIPVLVWGYPAASQLPHPLLYSVGTFSSAYLPLQRVEFLSFIAWQLTAVGVVLLYAISLLISLRVKVHPLTPWWAVLVAAGITLAGALPVFPTDLVGYLANLWSYYGLVLFIVLPAAMLLLGRVSAQAVPAT